MNDIKIMSRFSNALVPKKVAFSTAGTDGSEWVEGQFSDGWLQSSAKLHIYKAVKIEFDLFLPQSNTQNSTTKILSVYVNEIFVKEFFISRGQLETLDIDLDNEDSLKIVELRFDGLEVVTDDSRELGCMCTEMRVFKEKFVMGATPADFFDEQFYLSQVKGVAPDNALKHYYDIGWKLGLDPAPDFSTDAYLARYSDIRENGINPFEHFVLYGFDEGREVEWSTRLDESTLLRTFYSDIEPSVARLIQRTFQPHVKGIADSISALKRYLHKGWRERPVLRPCLFGKQESQSSSAQNAFSEKETALLLTAADKHLSNQDLCVALTALADSEWYHQRCMSLGVLSPVQLNMDIATHYVTIGRFFCIPITPIFHVPYYVDAVAETFGYSEHVGPENALFHYLTEGESAGLYPCAFFNPKYYKAQNNIGDGSPLVHFVATGAALGYQTSAVFWNEWYCETYDIGTENPLLHFYKFGIDAGFAPNPLIDLLWYSKKFDLGSETAALEHYVTTGFRNDLAPHPLIDPNYIGLQFQGNHGLKNTMPEVERYMRFPRELDPHSLFDTRSYLKRLKTAGVIDQPLAHYLDVASSGSKHPNRYFCDKTYISKRPDVHLDKLAPLLHYLAGGWREGNIAIHPLIDHDILVASVPNVDDMTALEVLVTGRAGSQVNLRRLPEHPDTKVNSKWGRVALDIDQAAMSNSDVSLEEISCGILAHVFYVELLDEVITFAQNLPQPSALLISTDSFFKKHVIEASLNNSGLPNWEVRVFENRGRDIAPSFLGFLDRLETLDYAVHIHTKKSPHYGAGFDLWRRYLFAENGGSRERVCSILRMFESNPTLGVLAPVDFEPVRSLISWGYNRRMVEGLLALSGRDVSLQQVSLELPSGSMFWFRTKALRGLFDSGLDAYHFDAEAGQVDGTLAHAIERAIFYLVEIEGYDWARFCTSSELGGGYKVTEEICFARSQLLGPDMSADPLVAKHPETHPFFCRAIENPRPRLNLLIPTADLQVGYAGVSEAVRQFRAIGERLQPHIDLRIIVTDVPFNNMTVSPKGFSVCDSLLEDSNLAVVPGFLRATEPLGLRINDVFVASAWWSARHAYDLIDAQNELFGQDDGRRMIYLVQDFEPGFYPWSTKWVLAENTYRHPERTIAIFNTPILADYMLKRYEFSHTEVYHPMINEKLMIPVEDHLANQDREKIVLLYARPHAERNCLDMLDGIVSECLKQEPGFWSDWRFLAIGEDFNPDQLRSGNITILGRLSLDVYRDYLSKSRLGISIMVSPHPSYPPLEMAANGVKVLANTYDDKDLSTLHENIVSFTMFNPKELAQKLRSMAAANNDEGKPLVDWFFDGQNNLDAIADSVGSLLRRDLGSLDHGS